VQLLCGCYRRDDAADPKVYASALIFVMEEYQIEVVEYVTSPRTGLPSTCKFLPSVAEVKAACESAKAAQSRPVAKVLPLGKPTHPSKVNPRMWDNPEAKARHERNYTTGEGSGGGASFTGLDGELAKISRFISKTRDDGA
jgi:hypothetical protein